MLPLKIVLLHAIDIIEAIGIAGAVTSIIAFPTSILLYRRQQQTRSKRHLETHERTKIDIGERHVEITTPQAQISVGKHTTSAKEDTARLHESDLDLLDDLDALLSLHSSLEVTQVTALRTGTLAH